MKKLIFIAFIVTLTITLNANITKVYNFSKPNIQTVNDYDIISFENTQNHGDVGEPLLPYLGVSLLAPQNEEPVSIEIVKEGRTEISSLVNIFPTQQNLPLSQLDDSAFTEQNADIYSKNEFYPSENFRNFSSQFKNGYGIGFVAITPIEYNPVTKKAYYYKNITVNMVTKTTSNSIEAQKFLKNNTQIRKSIARTIDNSELLDTYSERNTRNANTEYLIIAEQTKVSLWEQLKNQYIKFGLNTEIVTVESILSQTDGFDSQDKIRNYIINFYQNSELRFVLLAGDVEVIPSRGFAASAGADNSDDNIPADMYYSCFDTSWDENNNNIYGENAEYDLAPEIAIGRLTYDNNTDILNSINKIIMYSTTPVANETKTALMMGEFLWDPDTYGGDYMDEMIDGADIHGYATTGIPSADWTIDTLYERDQSWGATQCLSHLSEGYNLVNHLGHSNTTYGMHLYNDQITTNNITNNGTNNNFSIVYTQGCYSGAFDNRDTNGYYGQDCLTEKFIELENGVVSMIANSRYGWGQSGSTDGASQYFHRQFIDAIFDEEIYTAGEALVDAKIDNIPFIDSGVMFWCAYETNLIGDPALSIWTDNPISLVPSHQNEIFMGSNTYSVQVGVPGAVVSLIHENEIIGSAVSNEAGNANMFLTSPISFAGEMLLTIKAHDYLPYEAIITSIPSDGPYVLANEIELLEIGGNIDNSIQANDIVSFNLNLENIGTIETTSDIIVTLFSVSDFVEINQNSLDLSPISSGEIIPVESAFEVTLLPGIPDFTNIQFIFTVTSGEEHWNSYYTMSVVAPTISYGGYSYTVSGEDTIIDPGETGEILVTYNNTGNGFGYDLQIMASETNSYVSLQNSFVVIDQVDPLSEATSQQSIEFTIDPDFEGTSFQIDLFETDSNGFMDLATLSIPVGMSINNFETGEGEWEHSALSAGYSDEWHLSDFRNFTDSGEFSMKCGGANGSNYSDNVYAGLVSPIFPLPSNSFIKFRHWMQAETNSGNPDQAWDGGIIEISVNNGGFQQIAPTSGYPYIITTNDASPFPPGIGVISGSINWEEVELDLSTYSGFVQVRFVFGTDSAVNEEGWYIDELFVGSYTDNESDFIIPVTTILGSNYPNPFNPKTSINFAIEKSTDVKLEIFNIKGQKVKTLVNEFVEAGNHSIEWNGNNSNNKKSVSGVYFYKLSTPDYSDIKKMILLK